MIDEINYFPKRDNYQKKKKKGESDWKALKKEKSQLDSRKKSPSPPAQSPDPDSEE
jgi:hypothetical protein